jgi:hypothetical protein
MSVVLTLLYVPADRPERVAKALAALKAAGAQDKERPHLYADVLAGRQHGAAPRSKRRVRFGR